MSPGIFHETHATAASQISWIMYAGRSTSHYRSPDGRRSFSYLNVCGHRYQVSPSFDDAREHDYNLSSAGQQMDRVSVNRSDMQRRHPVEGGRSSNSRPAVPIVRAGDAGSSLILGSMEARPELPMKRSSCSSVSISSRQPRRINADPRRRGYSPDGKQIAYVRGPGLWYRKGYRGSANDDIWISNADGSRRDRRITNHNGQDSYPMWSKDGKQLAYVSDVTGGLANLTRIASTTSAWRIGCRCRKRRSTHHKDDGVRAAHCQRPTANGSSTSAASISASIPVKGRQEPQVEH